LTAATWGDLAILLTYFKKSLLLCVCYGAVGVATVLADTRIDRFEAYSDGQIIGANAVSRPWRRFGGATNDNVMATTDEKWVISGGASVLYGLVWPGSFGAVRYVFDEPTDLSPNNYVKVKMRSGSLTTYTKVRLAISNGRTTYVSDVNLQLSRQVQQWVFKLGPKHMSRNIGQDTYKQVIQGATTIGFDFRNNEDHGYETVVFDDFFLRSHTSGPETPTKVSAVD